MLNLKIKIKKLKFNQNWCSNLTWRYLYKDKDWTQAINNPDILSIFCVIRNFMIINNSNIKKQMVI